jgi:NAD-dependent DNA ligase
MIEEAGHVYQSSLTKDTNFLVIGENTGANKTKKAEKLGTKIITELGLIELLEGKQ